MKGSVCSLGILLLLVCPIVATGQSATTGALAGSVKSSAGAALPGAIVTLVDDATKQTQTATTAAEGI